MSEGSVTAWVRDEESLQSSVIIPPPADEEEQWSAPASQTQLQLSMEQYANLTGQEQLDWWSAGGTLKV